MAKGLHVPPPRVRPPIVVELSPPARQIGVRLQGSRRVYYVKLEWLYEQAMRMAKGKP